MSEVKDDERRHAALASQSRRAVLDLLGEVPEPMDAATVAGHIMLHVTTVRFHLEQLEKAGLVQRTQAHDGQRGRPRILFGLAPAARSEDGHRQLAEVLADALSSDPDGGRARALAAGARWADANTGGIEAAPDGSVVAPLVTVLNRLGFGPTLRGAGDEQSIDLLACPFRDIAAAHPDVVCSVHRGLVQQTLSTFGRDGDEAALMPFVEPERCVIPLHLASANSAARVPST